jgi:hypothetical protein
MALRRAAALVTARELAAAWYSGSPDPSISFDFHGA